MLIHFYYYFLALVFNVTLQEVHMFFPLLSITNAKPFNKMQELVTRKSTIRFTYCTAVPCTLLLNHTRQTFVSHITLQTPQLHITWLSHLTYDYALLCSVNVGATAASHTKHIALIYHILKFSIYTIN